MELRQLRYFVTVADLMSFTRAAGAVHVAQPALSRQIRNLEEELGSRLFYRDGRRVTLTDAGRTFYTQVKSVLRTLDAVKQELADDHTSPSGVVSFGLPSHVGPAIVVRLLSKFEATYPRARLNIVEGYSYQLADWLFTGRLDAALLYGADAYKNLVSEFNMAEELRLIAPTHDPITKKGPIKFSDLAALPLIAPLSGGTRACLDVASEQSGVHLKFAVEIDSLPAIKQLVKMGRGYAFLPTMMAQEEIAAGLLASVEVIEPVPRIRMALAVSKYGELSRLTRAIILLVVETIRETVDEGAWLAHFET